MEKYTFRAASLDDKYFLADVIIEAEKSLTQTLGLSTIFEMSESQIREYIVLMLEEEVDGCEFSISSFIIGCYEDIPVAALGGWLEGYYDDMPSSILKSNLISYVFPKQNVVIAQEKHAVIKDLQFDREMGSYQFEFSFVNEKHRGNRLVNLLMEEHFERAKLLNPEIKKAQLQPFENNPIILKVHSRMGFEVVKRFESNHSEVLLYMPDKVKLLMEKEF